METVMFGDDTNLSIHIEKIKEREDLDSYIEAIVWYHENETDMEMSDIVKILNPRMIDKIHLEASQKKLLKENLNLLTIDL